MTICDRIAVMYQGVIQQIGSPVELFDDPANRFVAEFVGSVNVYEGELRDGRFLSPTLGEITLPASLGTGAQLTAHLAFRPHAVRLDEAVPADGLQLEGRVASAEFLGEFMRYEIRVNEAIVTADQPHVRGTDRIVE